MGQEWEVLLAGKFEQGHKTREPGGWCCQELMIGWGRCMPSRSWHALKKDGIQALLGMINLGIVEKNFLLAFFSLIIPLTASYKVSSSQALLHYLKQQNSVICIHYHFLISLLFLHTFLLSKWTTKSDYSSYLSLIVPSNAQE